MNKRNDVSVPEQRKITDYFRDDGPFIEFEKKFYKWKHKYDDQPNRVYFKICFYCIFHLFLKIFLYCVSLKFLNLFSGRKTLACHEKPETTIKFLVYLRGGIGDIIMAGTYLKELYKWSDANCRFTIISDQNLMALRGIFKGYPFIDELFFRDDDYMVGDYEVIFDLLRFPRIVFMKRDYLRETAPDLYKLLLSYIDFEVDHQMYYRHIPLTDTIGVMYSLMNGHDRRTQSDLGHVLGMNDSTRPFITLEEDSFSILKSHHLTPGQYITIQRGTNANDKIFHNIRDWPIGYYNELIALLKARFPSLVFVHLGAKSPDVILEGIDVDLRGRTTFEELKVILKHTLLHIDGECGMVHLTHALNGQSAVFFAQTRIDFCGYPENINVKAEGECPLWCEWVTEDWQKKCLRGCDNPPCMKNLTPQLFMSKIENTIDCTLHQNMYSLQLTTESVANANVCCFIGSFKKEVLTAVQKGFKTVLLFDKNLNRSDIQDFKKEGIKAEYGDIYNIPLSNDSCDLVVCAEKYTSEFAENEILRLLKPGGIVDICSEKRYQKRERNN